MRLKDLSILELNKIPDIPISDLLKAIIIDYDTLIQNSYDKEVISKYIDIDDKFYTTIENTRLRSIISFLDAFILDNLCSDKKPVIIFLFNNKIDFELKKFLEKFNIKAYFVDNKNGKFLDEFKKSSKKKNKPILMTPTVNDWINSYENIDSVIYDDKERNRLSPIKKKSINIRIYGVQNPETFYEDIVNMNKKFKSYGRNVIFIEGDLDIIKYKEEFKENPIPDIRFNLIKDFSKRKSFERIVNKSLNDLKKNNIANIYDEFIIKHWIYDFISTVFNSESMPVLIYLGEIKNKRMSLLLQVIRELPMDILVISPDKNKEIVYLKDFTTITMPKTLENYNTIDNISLDSTELKVKEEIIHNFLYSDIINLYSKSASSIETFPINCTLSEIEGLIQNEPRYRYQYRVSKKGDVKLPTIFANIVGDISKTVLDLDKIREKKKDILIYSDIKKNLVSNIENYRNFLVAGTLSYRRLIENKHLTTISNKSDRLLSLICKTINEMLKLEDFKIQDIGDDSLQVKILSECLNIDYKVLELLEKTNYLNSIPLLIYYKGEQTNIISDAINLLFLQKVGFDILILSSQEYHRLSEIIPDKIRTF